MSDSKRPILVFGATGQQGGSVAAALLKAGWPVRALVRDTASAKSAALREAGVELVRGSFADTDAIRGAMNGVHGVFSVQPSSGQGPILGLSDEDEERFGVSIADLAVETGVDHLVYTSANGVSDEPTGMAHFDTKGRIEAHIRTLPINATIVRPAGFMDMLVMPGFGLDQGRFDFFLQPDQSMELIAVEDIGPFVAAIFADPARFGGQTLTIASDVVTGRDLETAFTDAAGQPITYGRFSDAVLAASPFLAKLTAMADEGLFSNKADLHALRAINPEMQTFRAWLDGTGREAFEKVRGTAGAWEYGTA
ncbi:NmrA/HSCARG family protein [Sphingomonas ginsenosidivorax]|uniref:NmrA/HSCARG family protein n=1 Tax=Sphingomonas ginsenosidivorax TaxID=862135 RepID=A0A5C6UHD9_9SPHN|nr:NmrA/HSCARG family protein [Sphingomonas ginsenosidivorax]TXC72232.1 NmrA/HSCARG family protein [Sphingomonas ginsenosidivorax]